MIGRCLSIQVHCIRLFYRNPESKSEKSSRSVNQLFLLAGFKIQDPRDNNVRYECRALRVSWQLLFLLTVHFEIRRGSKCKLIDHPCIRISWVSSQSLHVETSFHMAIGKAWRKEHNALCIGIECLLPHVA